MSKVKLLGTNLPTDNIHELKTYQEEVREWVEDNPERFKTAIKDADFSEVSQLNIYESRVLTFVANEDLILGQKWLDTLLEINDSPFVSLDYVWIDTIDGVELYITSSKINNVFIILNADTFSGIRQEIGHMLDYLDVKIDNLYVTLNTEADFKSVQEQLNDYLFSHAIIVANIDWKIL